MLSLVINTIVCVFYFTEQDARLWEVAVATGNHVRPLKYLWSSHRSRKTETITFWNAKYVKKIRLVNGSFSTNGQYALRHEVWAYFLSSSHCSFLQNLNGYR